MSLILRVDVDKPYGRATFLEKCLSKFRENFWFPALPIIGYLKHLYAFLHFLKEEGICAHIYFRKCTLPLLFQMESFCLYRHAIGVHIEDSRNYNSFKKEIDEISYYFYPIPISSFTKHGSGNIKLGKNHFAPYEPDKYLEWAKASGIPFLFGNAISYYKNNDDFRQSNYYPGAFWIDRLTDSNRYQIDEVLKISKRRNVVIIIHPENFIANSNVKKDMRHLVHLTKINQVKWVTI